MPRRFAVPLTLLARVALRRVAQLSVMFRHWRMSARKRRLYMRRIWRVLGRSHDNGLKRMVLLAWQQRVAATQAADQELGDLRVELAKQRALNTSLLQDKDKQAEGAVRPARARAHASWLIGPPNISRRRHDVPARGACARAVAAAGGGAAPHPHACPVAPRPGGQGARSLHGRHGCVATRSGAQGGGRGRSHRVGGLVCSVGPIRA